MKTAIIHISDLHLTDHLNADNIEINLTWLKDNDPTFVNDTINKILEIKKTKSIEQFLLVISGDLSNTSSNSEYEKTTAFLENFIEKIGIKKKNVLIVPGNHDINWLKNENAYDQQNPPKAKRPYLFYDEKYIYFKKFYDDFFSGISNFHTDKYIVRHLLLDDKILFIGLNSTLNSSYSSDKDGSIAEFIISELEKEINTLKQDVKNYDNYAKIAIFHHNSSPMAKESHQNSVKNWDNLLRTFKNNNIRVFLFGHEHIAGIFEDTREECVYMAVSGFALQKTDVHNFINIIEIIEDNNEVSLKTNFFQLLPDNGKGYPSHGFWNFTEGETYNKCPIILKKGNALNKTVSLFKHDVVTNPENQISAQTHQANEKIVYINDIDYSSKIFEEVKRMNIFKSGHFHWSDEAKAHNWLVIPSLLENREISNLCKKALINLFTKNIKKTDLIVGIGMEGCFLASNVSAKIDIPYSFIPYQFRVKDHDEYELKINHEPVNNLTIIIDVINTGSTIRNMLKTSKKYQVFFKKPEKINLISLFYTGERVENPIDLLKTQLDDNRIDFYYVCDKFRIHPCPYKNDFKTECVIYREKLDSIYEFYSQSSIDSE